MAEEPDIDDIQRRMDGALEVLRREYGGLRTGRASISLLDTVIVEAYESEMPLNQMASVSVPEARMLSVQVWDKSMVKAVEKAVMNAGLGLNPVVDGQTVRVPIPELNEERREELSRVAAKYAEQARIAVRNVRRDGMDTLKNMEKDGELSQDDQHIWGDEIQSITDDHIAKIDDTLTAKQQDIMQV
ncbi:MAG: ribosome recycling factor [Alphaproteobacteria bacterium]|jgi:ribosome recycling factor